MFSVPRRFSSGILRLVWGSDHSLFVDMTSRGWAATGQAEYGLQRVDWKGKAAFEIQEMKATPNGFTLVFTKPVNAKEAENPKYYSVTGFTYSYHKKYGSPVIDQKNCDVFKAEVANDGLSVRLYMSGLREGYVHQLNVNGLKTAAGEPLLHDVAYYTLNAIPQGTEEDKKTEESMAHSGHHAAANDAKGGCGVETAKNVTTMPAAWKSGADIEIVIGTKPGLKFDKELFEVPEGSRVKLIFNNNDDMLHNLLIAKKGRGEAVRPQARWRWVSTAHRWAIYQRQTTCCSLHACRSPSLHSPFTSWLPRQAITLTSAATRDTSWR